MAGWNKSASAGLCYNARLQIRSYVNCCLHFFTMRTYRVRAFQEFLGFGAILDEVHSMSNESPPIEEVQFLSIPIDIADGAEAEDGEVKNVANNVVSEVLMSSTAKDAEDGEVKNVDGNAVSEVLVRSKANDADAIMDEIDSYMYLDDFNDYSADLSFTGLIDVTKDASVVSTVSNATVVSTVSNATAISNSVVLSNATTVSTVSNLCLDVSVAASEGSCTVHAASSLGPGFRSAPDVDLVKAGEGDEQMKSYKNDNWVVKRADQLRATLGWDMSIDLGDLSFEELDTLLSDLFTRVVKVNGQEYPSESLMNMLGGFNRVIRRASEIRAVKGLGEALTKEFNIKYHACFPRTRLVLRAAVRKSAKNGNNKKRVKVGTITLEMEIAIKLDVDHQITCSQGCQKRLALYLMLRLGIRGGLELWNLMRNDMKLLTDASGREYISFEERESKNNSYDLDRTKEEQFRQTYYTYEDDFILTLKQYLRHLPPLGEGVGLDLFMQPIQSPAGLIWYNKVTKVSERVCGQWLKNMMVLVGLPPKLITSNKAGRVTLITRMAACGVPDEIGCLVTGHHTTDGYGRYDRTKELKMEAAVLAGCTPGLAYDKALSEVSKKFVQEKIIGSSVGLRPLMDKATSEREVELRRDMRLQLDGSLGHVVAPNMKRPLEICADVETQALQARESAIISQQQPEVMQMNESASRMASWHQDYDAIDWEVALQRDPMLARALEGRKVVNTVAGNSFSNMQNCTIQIICQPPKQEDKENMAPVAFIPGDVQNRQ